MNSLIVPLALIALLGFLVARVRDRKRIESLPLHQRQLLEAAKQAAAIERKDPAAAQRLVHEAVEAAGLVEDRQKAELVSRAPRDRAAAVELRRRLIDELEQLQQAHMGLERSAATDSDGRQALRKIEAAQQDARTELARVDAVLAHGG